MNRLVLASLVVPGICVAAAPQDIVDHCRGAPSDAERIACLETGLLTGEVPAREDATVVGVVPPAAEESGSPSTATDSATIADIADTQDDPVPDADDIVVERAPQAQPTGIGASQVIARSSGSAERLEQAHGLRVAEYGYVPYRRLVVTLENGQVWRQINGDDRHVRVDLDRNQTVDIEESRFGGYRLRLNEMRRSIIVERIR